MVKKNNKTKLISLFSVISAIALISSYFLFARPEYNGHAHYKGSDNKWYWAEFYTDDLTGDKYTKIWVNGQNPPHIGNGHKTPNKFKEDGGDTLQPPPPPDREIGINLRYNGDYLFVETNQPVESTIIDPLTGNIVEKTFTVDYRQSIPTVNLEKGKTYLIWSTNNAGENDGTSFILNEDHSIYISY